MKIALVILHADPARGGAERYTIDLAMALMGRGHDVTLVASSFCGEVVANRAHLPAKAITRLGQYVKFLNALDVHFTSHSYDIIHAMLPIRRCDVYHPHAGLAVEGIESGHVKYDGIRRQLAGIANRFNPKRRRFASVERDLLNAASPPVVLCLSEYIKATVRKHYSLPERNLATLFNAVDLKKFDPAARADARAVIRQQFNIHADQVVALMIAQDFRRKGLTSAIVMLPRDDKRMVLLVVGKEKTTLYEQIAKHAGIEDRIIFAGPTKDPYAFYKAADFFVLPTRHDPCSLVVLEALAMGVPVISTNSNGACEIMIDGTHGFVIDGQQPSKMLLECYRKMLDNPARRKMSEACLSLRPQLSQEHHLDRLLEAYSRVKSNQT